jgi:hypothetical protein
MKIESVIAAAMPLGGWELSILISIALFAFWIWMIVDCAKHEQKAKAAWLVFIIVFIVGAPLYFLIRKLPRQSQRSKTSLESSPQVDTTAAGSPPSAQARMSTLAVASLVMSLLSAVVGPLGALPGIILGHWAKRNIRRHSLRGSGLATTGLVIGYVALAAWTAWVVSSEMAKR